MARPYMGGTSVSIKEITAATTLGNVDHGKTILMNAGADNVVITLPALAKGLEFTFVQTKASAGSTCRITPVGGKIIGYVSQQEGGNADATTADGLTSVLDGADNKYVQLTKATGHQGNFIKIVCDGSDWFVVGGIGTFAHES
jgi:hypothetical protein